MKILLTYRNNDLFPKFVPVIIKTLKEQGHEVDVVVHPAGVPVPDEISTDGYDVVLPDETCGWAAGFKKVPRIIRGKERMTLDNLIFYGTFRKLKTVAGKLGSQKDALAYLVREAVKAGAPEPTEIVLVEESMKDHGVVPGVSQDKEACAAIAQWFQGLFPSVTVRTVETMRRACAPDVVRSRWVIADRHAKDPYITRIKRQNGLFFQLPMESGILDLHAAGFYPLDVSVVEDDLVALIRGEFTGAG